MSRENHEKQMEWMQQEWAMQDQSRLLQRQNAELQMAMQTEMAQRTREHQVETERLTTAIGFMNQKEQERNQLITIQAQTGQLANQEMNILNNALSLATTRMAAFRTALANLSTVSYPSSSGYYPTPSNGSSAGSSAGGGWGGFQPFADGGPVPHDFMMHMKAYDAGGPMPDVGKFTPTGVVHGGEWVVPQDGALVKQGDNPQTVKLLERIESILLDIKAMGPGRVNAQIYTNQSSVRTSEITSYDKMAGSI